MENVTSQQIQMALQRAKTDAAYGAELQKRLETGNYDAQLSELGITRTPQGLKKTTEVATVSETESPSLGESITESIKTRSQNIADIQSGRQAGESAVGELIGKVSPQAEAAIKPAVSAYNKVASLVPGTPGVAEAGQAVGLFGDVMGSLLGAITPKKWKQFGEEKAAQIAKTGLGKLGIDTIEKYDAWAKENPMTAKNIEGAINVASILPVGKGVGVVTEVGEVAAEQGAKVAGKVATQAGKAGTRVGEMASGVSKVAGDVIPTRQQLVSDQLTKALDLTQGDVSNILLSTGNDVGEFIARNNLIKGNKKETVAAVKELTDQQYKVVRDNIKQVTKDYTSKEIADVKKSLSVLKKEVKDIPGLEKVYSQVVSLGKKSTYKLEDVQKIKELLDDQFSLYKATGDVKDVTKAKGLANVRKSLKEFIEKEVRDTTGADIAQLNNDVATGKSIINLSTKRSTRGLTRANVSLSDLGAFAGGSAIGSPLVGAAALIVKRIGESPTIRLKVANFLNSLGKTEKAAIKKQLLSGEAPESIKKIVSQARGVQPSAKSTKISTANASIDKVLPKSTNTAKELSTDKGIIQTAIENLKNPAKRKRGSIEIPGLSKKEVPNVSYSKNVDINDLLKKEFSKVDYFVSDNKSYYELNKIIVPKSERNKGIGSRFMKKLIAISEKTNKPITLTPGREFGGSITKLNEFYKRFGFVKNKDLAKSGKLIRYPN